MPTHLAYCTHAYIASGKEVEKMDHKLDHKLMAPTQEQAVLELCVQVCASKVCHHGHAVCGWLHTVYMRASREFTISISVYELPICARVHTSAKLLLLLCDEHCSHRSSLSACASTSSPSLSTFKFVPGTQKLLQPIVLQRRAHGTARAMITTYIFSVRCCSIE